MVKRVGETQKTPKLSELIENFCFYNKKFSTNTIITYRKVLKDLLRHTGDDLENIRVETLETYIIKKRRSMKAASCNLYVNAIKSFYKWLAQYGYTDLGKYLQTEAALPPDQRILNNREYLTVCQASESDELVCFKFLCHTGLRVTEFVQLKRENIANNFLRVIGKGRRNRSIPLNSTALAIVKKIL